MGFDLETNSYALKNDIIITCVSLKKNMTYGKEILNNER